MIAIVISVIAMVVIVLADQISKYVMVSAFNVGDLIGAIDVEALEPIVDGVESIEVIPGVFRFTLVLNRGMAFGALDNARWVFLILSTLAIVAVLVYLFWKRPQNKLLLTALVLVTGGGIGNMIDRIKLGYVIDFLDFCAFPKIWPWVFNVADAFVCVGAGLLALWLILDTIKEMKAEKLRKMQVVEIGVDNGALNAIVADEGSRGVDNGAEVTLETDAEQTTGNETSSAPEDSGDGNE